MPDSPEPADLIFEGGAIVTMEGPDAEALAVRGDRIVAVGSREDVAPYRGGSTRGVDLGGRALLPGFVDAHTHLVDHGVMMLRLDLGGLTEVSQVYEMVAQRAKMTPPQGWVVGHSWDESKWEAPEMPTRERLDAAAGGRPVLLMRIDLHMGVASTAALEATGLDVAKFPEGHVREEDFYRVVERTRPAPATLQRGIDAAVRRFHELGITSAGVIADAETLAALEEARDAGRLGVRCHLYLREPSLDVALERGGPGAEDPWVRVLGLKLFTDGSIGSCTAAVTRPYRTEGNGHGELLYGDDRLRELCRRAHEGGLQLAVHCIGDRAVEQSLDAIEALGDAKARRHRLEHLELFSDADADRMARLGVVASSQPNFVAEWGHPGHLYEKRLGSEVVGEHNRFRDLADRGVHLAFGSDGMPYGPLYGVHGAVNAPTARQRLRTDEALLAYTEGAARALFAEDRVGTLAPGKLADLVVLSEDPRAVAPERVRDVRVDATFVGGVRVYTRPGVSS